MRLGRNQRQMLARVAENPTDIPGAMEALGMNRGQARSSLQTLTKNGYVAPVPDSDPPTWAITEQGRELLTAAGER